MRTVKNESGYTLIESIGFIAVLTMLTVAIISLVSNMLDKYRVSRVTQQIVDIQKAIDYRFSSKEDYSDLTVKLLIDEKIIPGDMTEGNKFFHAYKGDVKIKDARGSSVYEIEFAGLPLQPCIELAMIDWTSGHNSHLLYMSVNGTNFVWFGKENKLLPMQLGNALTACKANRSNEIVWQFQ